MAISINTLTPAQIALKDLAGDSSAQVAPDTQTSASTQAAQAVSSVLSTAQTPSSGILALSAVTGSLNRASTISDVASAAGQTVSDLLSQLKSLASAATDPSVSGAARQSLDSSFQSVLGQVQDAVNSASFDGANLLNGSQSGGATFVASTDGTSLITLSATNLSLGGPNVSLTVASNLGTATAAASALSQVDTSLTSVNQALETLGSQASQIAAHSGVVTQLNGALQGGTASLVNSDLTDEGARLQALQLQQLLSAQAAPIANQAPQALLSLLR